MKRHLFVVGTYAHPGRKPDLERWYVAQHIPDLLKVPGIVGATRYAVSPVKFPAGVAAPDCITIYDFETDDPAGIMAELGRRAGTPDMKWTDSLDSSRTIAFIATPQD